MMMVVLPGFPFTSCGQAVVSCAVVMCSVSRALSGAVITDNGTEQGWLEHMKGQSSSNPPSNTGGIGSSFGAARSNGAPSTGVMLAATIC